MLAAGYHQPTARSAALKVHSREPLTLWMKPDSAPGPRTSGSGTGFANAKWENAPWIRYRVLTGLFAPLAAGGGEFPEHRPQALLADDASPVLHLVVRHAAQHLFGAVPQAAERIRQALRAGPGRFRHGGGVAEHGRGVAGDRGRLAGVLGRERVSSDQAGRQRVKLLQRGRVLRPLVQQLAERRDVLLLRRERRRDSGGYLLARGRDRLSRGRVVAGEQQRRPDDADRAARAQLVRDHPGQQREHRLVQV